MQALVQKNARYGVRKLDRVRAREKDQRKGLRGRGRCVAPRACRRRERCLFEARFSHWPLAWRKIWAVTMFDLAV